MSSGTRATTVRVNARIADTTIVAQSGTVAVVGALPAFNRFSMAAAFGNVAGRVTFGLEDTISAFLNDRFGNAVPEGTVVNFFSNGGSVVIENVFVLPGIPEIFQRKLAILRVHLADAAAPFVSRAVYTRMDEAILKPLLDAVVSRNPEVEVGSYPRWNDPKYDTKITFDGKKPEAVDRALEDFLSLLPPGEPQWTE